MPRRVFHVVRVIGRDLGSSLTGVWKEIVCGLGMVVSMLALALAFVAHPSHHEKLWYVACVGLAIPAAIIAVVAGVCGLAVIVCLLLAVLGWLRDVYRELE